MSKKLITVAAMVACVASLAFAQKVEFHGYMDYSTYLGGYSTKDGAADWVHSDLGAYFGSWYSGRTELNTVVTAPNFFFTLGIRLSSNLTDWYSLYGLATENKDFFKGNMRVDFLEGQARWYTGIFEEESFGYHTTSFAYGWAYSNDWAVRDWSQAFTGIELKPNFLPGFSMLAGLPIQPEEVKNQYWVEDTDNYFQNLLPQFRIGAKYYISPINITVMAGLFNALYNTDVNNTTTNITYSESTTKFREAYLNADMPNFLHTGVNVRFGYNWQQRLANLTEMKHNVMLSASFKPLTKLWMAIDGRFGYADGFDSAVAEDIYILKFAGKATYDLPSKMQLGLVGTFAYLSDSSGLVADGRVNDGENYYDDGELGFWINTDWKKDCTAITSSAYSGVGIGYGANLYLQKNFSNGYASIGALFQMNQYTSGQTNTAMTYAIPIMFCFWF